MKEKILSWIEKAGEEAIELERELTKYPAVSPESGGQGELEKCLFLEKWLKEHGITELERYDASDDRAKGQVRPNLIAAIPGENDVSRLWILSHMDVVPPGDERLWDSDPWTLACKDSPQGKRLYGRGTEDNQQGIASSIICALAFLSSGIKPARTIKLLFLSDEETGSAYGINYLVQNHSSLFNKDDFVLIPDSGDRKGGYIEIAEKNILWVKFETKGKQTHGSKPELGANSFLAGSDLALSLHYGLSQKFNKRDCMFNPPCSTFQPTKKEANVPNVNTIPGEDIFYMDMRILPCYSCALVLSEIEAIKKEIEKKHGVKIEYSIIQKAESRATSEGSPVFKNLSNAVKEIYNVQPKPLGIGGGTVAAPLRNLGIDCAVWSKNEETLHQPNEYVLLENILGDAKVMALLAMATSDSIRQGAD